MNYLPEIVYVRVNSGRTVLGTFIDQEWVIHLIAAGSWSFRMKGRRYRVKTGDMVLIPPRLLHEVNPLSEGKRAHYVIHFLLPESSLPKDFVPAIILPSSTRKKVLSLFREIQTEWANHGSGYRMVAEGLLSAMIGIYLQNMGRARIAEQEQENGWQNVETAIQFLHENYARCGLTLHDISKASGLSVNYFCRAFKKNTGYSPMSYLNLLRLQKAETLLIKKASLNCTQIAEATGYINIHLFSRNFKKHHGIAPLLFRKRHAPRFSEDMPKVDRRGKLF